MGFQKWNLQKIMTLGLGKFGRMYLPILKPEGTSTYDSGTMRGSKKETNNLSYNENRNYYYTSSYKDAGRLCFVSFMVLILYQWCSKLITIYFVSTATMK